MNSYVFLNKKNTVLILILVTSFVSRVLPHVVDINGDAQYNDLMKQTKPIVVQFASSWCGVCQGVKKPFEEVSTESTFKNITFARVDIDKISDKSGIIGVPTFAYLNNGQKVDESIGVESMDGFKDELRNNINKNLMNDTAEELKPDVMQEKDMMMPDKAVTTEKPEPESEQGFIGNLLNQLLAFIMLIINAILSLIKMILDWIKSFFS